MPLQAVAQDAAVGQFIVAGSPAINHLRLRLEILVEREQRIKDQVTEIARDISRRPDRVDASQVRLRNEPQSLLRTALRPPDRRDEQGHECCRCCPSQCLRERNHALPVRYVLSANLRDPRQGRQCKSWAAVSPSPAGGGGQGGAHSACQRTEARSACGNARWAYDHFARSPFAPEHNSIGAAALERAPERPARLALAGYRRNARSSRAERPPP